MTGLQKLFVAVLLAAGLLAGGLQVPVVMKQRDIAHDKQVVEDLERISDAVEERSSSNDGKLPATLNEIELSDELKSRIGNYKYKPKTASSYELCATFKTDASTSKDSYKATSRALYSLGPDTENHKKGEQCFTYTTASGFDFGNYFNSSSYLFDDSSTPDSALDSSSAKDSERKTNVNMIASKLELHFALEDQYPTTTQLNDTEWRESNDMPLDSDVLTGAGKLKNEYTYTTTPANCNNVDVPCEGYTLSVKLSNGSLYTKTSAN